MLCNQDGTPTTAHVFGRRDVQAINAALAAERPLLLRGEPGIGKSQLARAAAKALQRHFVHHVVDLRSESRDLLWHYDAVERLADAQLSGALKESPDVVQTRLDVCNYLYPRALWWAFDWGSAREQAIRTRTRSRNRNSEAAIVEPHQREPDALIDNGCVVLIDEIDKAEADMPNGLLEALGAGEFTPQGWDRAVVAKRPLPLVIITTNEERTLPDAFIRRCLVLHLEMPEEEEKQQAFLLERGRAHFKGEPECESVLEKAAELTITDRKHAEEKHLRPLPGQAEYLDLLRAVFRLNPGDPEQQKRVMDEIAEFTLQKPKGAR
ncbi:MAG: AAA family ATPase [Magnetococcales bacterium]|nr:AAA family ATPase [Magnetococcales bacterium]